MPEFSTLPRQEAILLTVHGRMRPYFPEYIGYLTQRPFGQAGKLTARADESVTTIRQRLAFVAAAMELSLIIRRRGNAVYFWREEEETAAPQPRRRTGRAGGIVPRSPPSVP
jgi:hypothetical protein